MEEVPAPACYFFDLQAASQHAQCGLIIETPGEGMMFKTTVLDVSCVAGSLLSCKFLPAGLSFHRGIASSGPRLR